MDQFCALLQIKWDEDALIVVNHVICHDKSTTLNDGDQIKLLIPISGG
ncbi:MoaD/ThiS family protein [Anaerobacillus sp. HL2]|nr:MoaD/ThiS family protein [Anaerobacillus sp. HL2]